MSVTARRVGNLGGMKDNRVNEHTVRHPGEGRGPYALSLQKLATLGFYPLASKRLGPGLRRDDG